MVTMAQTCALGIIANRQAKLVPSHIEGNYQLRSHLYEKQTQFSKEKMSINFYSTKDYEYEPSPDCPKTNPTPSTVLRPLSSVYEIRDTLHEIQKMKNEPNFLASQNEHKPSYNKGL